LVGSPTSSAYDSGSTLELGNIGNGIAVSISNEIIDSNGNLEVAISSGESGTVAPV
jgi:hypothetical protein